MCACVQNIKEPKRNTPKNIKNKKVLERAHGSASTAAHIQKFISKFGKGEYEDEEGKNKQTIMQELDNIICLEGFRRKVRDLVDKFEKKIIILLFNLFLILQ